MSLEVLQAGPLSLIQDYGRLGQQHQGMSPGGPADQHAFAWANRLLDNPPTAAMLEITLGPCRLKLHANLCIALCGAQMQAHCNGQPLENWCSHSLKAGDELELGMARVGLRSYLAVAGGLQVTPQYGSCASVQRDALGGLYQDGQPLRNGDIIACDHHPAVAGRSVPLQFQPDYTTALTLRLLAGYQWDDFEPEAREQLLNSHYSISSAADRMGYRLQGPALAAPAATGVSEGIAYGAVQVPPDGQPIVLLTDRQSIGGYPKAGCIASLDAAQLAQRRPGQSLRFGLAKLDTISHELQSFQRFFGLSQFT